MENNPMSEILTVEQVAEYLQLDPETVRRAARKGELPGARIGRRWRFRKEDLDALFVETVVGRQLAEESERRLKEDPTRVPLAEVKRSRGL
jgi:excisionase family DNA binding protein